MYIFVLLVTGIIQRKNHLPQLILPIALLRRSQTSNLLCYTTLRYTAVFTYVYTFQISPQHIGSATNCLFLLKLFLWFYLIHLLFTNYPVQFVQTAIISINLMLLKCIVTQVRIILKYFILLIYARINL